MEVFFIKYRKSLLAASAFMFLYFFYEVYEGIESITSIEAGKTGEGIGTLINACISLFVSVYFFIKVRKANKKYKEEMVALSMNNDGSATL